MKVNSLILIIVVTTLSSCGGALFSDFYLGGYDYPNLKSSPKEVFYVELYNNESTQSTEGEYILYDKKKNIKMEASWELGETSNDTIFSDTVFPKKT